MRNLANVLGWCTIAAFLFIVCASEAALSRNDERDARPVCCEFGTAHSDGCATCAVMKFTRRPFNATQAHQVAQIRQQMTERKRSALSPTN